MGQKQDGNRSCVLEEIVLRQCEQSICKGARRIGEEESILGNLHTSKVGKMFGNGMSDQRERRGLVVPVRHMTET